jgi:beta-N-acetylhexosaminidase
MNKKLLLITATAVLNLAFAQDPIKIIDKPIIFKQERIDLTKAYIKKHYGFAVDSIEIVPKIIVLHWTADMSLKKSFNRLKPQRLFSDRKDISSASALNVSSHFLVARDGTIYRLMPENWMARHVIGLNYSSIGVENVGGKNNKKEDLTPAQVKSNIKLIRYLKAKYPTITKLIGHYEYRELESSEDWLELDSNYRTEKRDPGERFMRAVRSRVSDLNLTRVR